ncbi:MAG: DnaD domain protein [Dehalococcoidia bacterium]|nr:DnaD domain protein [Dehalococcoidia bacterium]
MNDFIGFPASMQFTPIPKLFINCYMSDMNADELKCLLHVFQIIYAKKGQLRYVSMAELLSDTALVSSLQKSSVSVEQTIKDALDSARERGIIVAVEVQLKNSKENLYLINTPSDLRTAERIRNGEIKLPFGEALKPTTPCPEPRNIFRLYEDNIGMLTPIIAEELNDALEQYSEEWIRDAIHEATTANKRNWRYIARVLERWNSDGRRNGKYQSDFAQNDPDRFICGAYGHLIQR